MPNPTLVFETALLLTLAYAMGCVIGYFGRAAWRRSQKSRADERFPTKAEQVSETNAEITTDMATISVETDPPAALEIPVPSAVAADEVAAETVTEAPAGDDLTRIKGIGPKLAGRLMERGVTRYQQIAGWSADEADEISRTFGFPGRARRDRWVEQAQDLCAERLLGPGAG